MAIEARDFDPSNVKLPSLEQALDDTFDTIYEPGPSSNIAEALPKEKIIFDRAAFEALGRIKSLH